MNATLFRALFASMVLALHPAPGQARPADVAGRAASGVPDSWLRLWQTFNEQTGGGWRFEWNAQTRTPHRISGHFVELARVPTQETVETMARDVVTRYAALLRADPDHLVVVQADFEAARTERGEGTWRVVLRQMQEGVPVRGGAVRLVIRGRRLTMLGSDYFPGVDAPAAPAVSASEATAIVERTLGLGPRTDAAPTAEPTLAIVPRREGNQLRYPMVWVVTAPVLFVDREVALPRRVPSTVPAAASVLPAQWRYDVDTVTGEVLGRTNVLSYETLQGTVTGLVHPLLPSDVAVTQALPHLSVTVTQGAITKTGVTDASGHYAITGLSAGPGSLAAHLTGPYIATNDKALPDPDATHLAACTVPGTHDWSFAGDDQSTDDVQTNAFFHANVVHDWFTRGTPFDLSPPVPLKVTVNYGAYCGAGGGASELFFGNGGGVCADAALCADAIYHEYTHAITHTVYDALGIDLGSLQAAAMNEAWSDYFSSSITNDPVFGVECGDVRNIDTPDARYPTDFTGESHKSGIIFAGALWDIRSLGADQADSLAIRALKQGTTSFSEYLGAILEEDDDPSFSPSPLANDDLADGSPNIDLICHSYVDLHGIFHPACAGHTESPVAEITTPDPADFVRFDGSVPIAVVGSALGSATGGMQGFSLEYALATAPNVWLTAGVTLTGGGTVDVAQADLASIDTGVLADGAYALRLTVTDGNAQTAVAWSSFIVDRRLRPGWPQLTDVTFWGTPVVAELDPAYPGREIVAFGDGSLYVWHADGTLLPGWPQSAGFNKPASPAVADLDGDGAPEIVFADEAGLVRVHHADGTTAAGWGQNCAGTNAQAALADLDGDGTLEIVVGTTSGKVCAWHHDGTTVSGWPITVGAVSTSVTLVDLDHDGRPEVVFGDAAGAVHARHGDGSVMAGWPQAVTGAVGSAGAAGDLDGDGTPEIVVASQAGVLHAWHADGSVVAGWPQAAPQQFYPATTAALADIDGDDVLDVLAMASTGSVFAWHADGSPFAASPLGGQVGYYSQPYVEAPLVGDVDGQGPSVIAVRTTAPLPSGKYPTEIRATRSDGSVVPGFPLTLATFSGSGAVLADLEGDGHVELIAVSDGLYVWNLPGSGPASAAAWPMERHDLRRTGAVSPAAAVALLFDTSGSMSWRHDGTMGVPVEEQRITKAKEAASPFLELLGDFGANEASFGIATFPAHPSVLCEGEVVSPMTAVTDASIQAAVSTTVPGLTTGGGTPLLAGMNMAQALFNGESQRAIVLLSDGYHNCPSPADPADPEVVDLVGRLQADGVRVFTIGFGKPTDIDHPLLEALAEETTPPSFGGSQFYDVTGPTFDPLNWDPATALHDTYKSVLVDALGLQAAADPMGTLGAGQVATRSVHLSEYDRRVSFFLSWVTSDPQRLTLTVHAADGSEVVAGDPGVRVHHGNTYTLVTVARELLSQPGKVGPAPWELTIAGPRLRPGEEEKYQYSVIVDSALRLKTRVRPAFAGAPLVVAARITAGGHPVLGLADVWMRVARPVDSVGNWLTVNRVTAAQLARIPSIVEGEPIPPRQRRAQAIEKVLGIAPPGSVAGARLRLFDDGTHGDVHADDGIYTNVWTSTSAPGSYRILVSASGRTPRAAFDREVVTGRRLGLAVSTTASPRTLSHSGPGPATLTVVPKDDLGNFLGPGRASAFRIVPGQGRMDGRLTDLGDGRYRQVLIPPRGVSASDVDITLETVAP